MTSRYQYVQTPLTFIVETPAQAYMVIEASTKNPKLYKQSRRKRCDSVKMFCKCMCSSQRKSHIKQKARRTKRLESIDQTKKQRQSYSNAKKSTQQAISFRNLNSIDDRNQITCNYKKMIQQQNHSLRKQNRFLQQYIKTLQVRYKGRNSQRSENQNNYRNLRNYQTFTNSRNSFLRRKNQSGKNSDTDQGSSFSNKITHSKGQNQWTSYRA